MQSYTEIADSTTLQVSRGQLLNNDKTVMSCSSGTTFPTADLQVGMLCLRTDQNKLYQLKDATPTWILIADLTKTITDKGYVDTELALKADLTYVDSALAGKASLGANTFTGTQNMNNQHVDNAKTVTFNAEYDNGNSGTSKTINWGNGQKQKLLLTGNVTLTFTAPAGPGHFQLKLTQDATGGRTVTWPAGTKRVGNVAPTITSTANAVDVANIYYDGTTYWLMVSNNWG